MTHEFRFSCEERYPLKAVQRADAGGDQEFERVEHLLLEAILKKRTRLTLA